MHTTTLLHRAGSVPRKLWERIPGGKSEVAVLWVVGFGLGLAAFRASLELGILTALACWACVLTLGLVLAFRAEPILWEARPPLGPRPGTDPEPAPAPPPPPPPVRPLLELVEIPGGTSHMGSPPATEEQIRDWSLEWAEALDKKPEEVLEDVRRWHANEQPRHPVQVSPFRMARRPLTRGQWREVMAQAPEEWSRTGDDDALPATHLDWHQALECCNALSEREALAPCYRKDAQDEWRWDRGAGGYRLPTEAEWEHACRAETETPWFWGDDPKDADAHAWYRGNSGHKLQPVGGKAPNPWGLYDMAGLVLEWCWDRFGAYPQPGPKPTLDPTGPEEGDGRVVRGGAFDGPPFGLRSAVRFFVRPGVRDVSLGLRCVRSRARQP